jgi:hypothetical protein
MLDLNVGSTFRYDPIFVKISERPPDAPYPPSMMYINYISDPAVAPYRFTDRGTERHYEALSPMMGSTARKIVPGKIHPSPRAVRAITQLTDADIFCFGRFAAWNPEELIHETYTRILAWADRLGLGTKSLSSVDQSGA